MLSDKVNELKAGAIVAARIAQFWENQIKQHGEEKATAFYKYLGLNHLDTKYDPNQPRDPAGTSTGGQWTGGAGTETSKPEPFSPAKSIEEAEAYARSLGVRYVDYHTLSTIDDKGKLDVANRTNGALWRAYDYGTPLPTEIKVDDRHFIRRKAQNVGAEYVSEYEMILINSRSPTWSAEQVVSEGWASSNDPYHVITHEIGHHAHYVHSREKWNQILEGNILDVDNGWPNESEKAMAEATVSKYAAKHPIEFVAETYAMASAGNRVPSWAVAKYRELGGPPIGGYGRPVGWRP